MQTLTMTIRLHLTSSSITPTRPAIQELILFVFAFFY